MDKLKVAMLGHKRIPSREGGIEIVVEELAIRMARLGHKITVYNRRGHHVSGKEFDVIKRKRKESYRGIQLISVPTTRKKGLAAITSSFFAAWKATFGGNDIIHFHAEGPSVMLMIPWLFHKRTVVTIHGLDWKRGKWGKTAAKYLLLGEKIAAKHADAIIVLNSKTQQYFIDKYHRSTIYIPNGINRSIKKEANLITQQFGLKQGQYILFLGRIVPEKGIEYLIEAYMRTDTHYPLVIAGGVSDSQEFMTLIKNKACKDQRIIFTDFVSGDLLEELYSNTYLYVLPSDLEGMPISLLEAMSYGNCCLTSDIPEITEALKDKGITFKHGNTEDLYQKLDYLLKHKETVDKYRLDASDYICSAYNWDRTTEDTIELYYKLTGDQL